jgi:hypothetical protein
MRLSQTALARMAAVSRFRLCSSENGSCRLTQEERDRIQAALRREALRLQAIAHRIDAAGAEAR